jgi:small subunit ribosomal protein S8
MTMTDPVADFLTRLRNAARAQKETVAIPSSRLKRELARILAEQGYIEGFELAPPIRGRAGGQLVLRLKYTEDRRPVISRLARVSRPGRRVYVGADDVPKILGGMGTAIVSTSRGVMTGHEARQARVGGEVVAEIW